MKKKTRARESAKKRSTRRASAKNDSRALREQVVYLLKGGGAHVHFMDAVEGFPAGKYGTFAPGMKHTGWQLLEHARIAQWDILEFTTNPKHVSPNFPGGYWPRSPMPADEEAWRQSVAAFERDLKEMVSLVENPRTDLFAKIPHGEGQTVLREALVLADHNSYHLGQLVDVRRALGAWPEE